jgi:hypothetical protein
MRRHSRSTGANTTSAAGAFPRTCATGPFSDTSASGAITNTGAAGAARRTLCGEEVQPHACAHRD